MIRSYRRAVVGVAAVLGSLLPGAVLAADNGLGANITSSPLPIALSAKPGTTVTTDLRVKNNNADVEPFKVTLLKFGAYGDEGHPRIQDFGPGDDYKNWVSFSPSQFPAPPNVWQTVHMTIKIPKTAALGYYYAVVFSRANTQNPQGGQAALNGAVASLVLLDAETPNARRTMQLEEFDATKKVYEYLPSSFTVKVRNTGNIHTAPIGNIFISKGKNQIGNIPVNQGHGFVLPQSNRIFTADWSNGYPTVGVKQEDDKIAHDKKGNPIKQVKWGNFNPGKFRFGKYTAHLVFTYDNGKEDVPLEGVVSFWVIPWRLLLIALAIVALIGAGIWSIMRGIGRQVGGRRRR